MRALFGWGEISGTPSCDAAGCIWDRGAGAEGRQRAAKGELEQPELGGTKPIVCKDWVRSPHLDERMPCNVSKGS